MLFNFESDFQFHFMKRLYFVKHVKDRVIFHLRNVFSKDANLHITTVITFQQRDMNAPTIALIEQIFDLGVRHGLIWKSRYLTFNKDLDLSS